MSAQSAGSFRKVSKRWSLRHTLYFTFLLSIAVCVLRVYRTAQRLELSNYRRYVDTKLEETLKHDKGSGCKIPKLNPFSPEIMAFDKRHPKITCPGLDWQSECRVIEELTEITTNIECKYQDIIYIHDREYIMGKEVNVYGKEAYILKKSDHAKVHCWAPISYLTNFWKGHVTGIRRIEKEIKPPKGREQTHNVLILGFDSASKNGFIRKMPKSYKVLTEELKANVLNGYNILGDGTTAALFPILTGRTELELPETRRFKIDSHHVDHTAFIFFKLKSDGYQTAYFEDSPRLGTFQLRHTGFLFQPADHYLRPFFMEVQKTEYKKYCVGATPQFKLMLDITKQFFLQNRKKFCFTFIGDITHDDFNLVSTADDDVAVFLREFKAQGYLKNTLLMVMGDHGPRYESVRETYQGKLEERLPLMAVVLPDELKAARPEAQRALKENEDVLTTPHDIHATLLDVVDMRHHWNPHKVKGADLKRGLSLLEPIPRNRSCSEAGVESHWCVCFRWKPLPPEAPMYKHAASALVQHLNAIIKEDKEQCLPRTLKSIQYVMREQVNKAVLSFVKSQDKDGFLALFSNKTVEKSFVNYQVRITVGPRRGVYEALVTYVKKYNHFSISTRDISRINAYGNEPDCVRDMKPHLMKFCFCKNVEKN